MALICPLYRKVSHLFQLTNHDPHAHSQKASEELHGRPIHDHQVLLDDLLATDSTVLKMDMATVTVSDLEVKRLAIAASILCTLLYR